MSCLFALMFVYVSIFIISIILYRVHGVLFMLLKKASADRVTTVLIEKVNVRRSGKFTASI